MMWNKAKSVAVEAREGLTDLTEMIRLVLDGGLRIYTQKEVFKRMQLFTVVDYEAGKENKVDIGRSDYMKFCISQERTY